MALKGRSKRAIQDGVDNLKDFKVGNVSGRNFGCFGDAPKGRLTWEPAYSGAWGNQPVYVVYSYHTPIAWRFTDEDMWIIPKFHYNMATTNHQKMVRMATSNPGFYADAKW